MHSLASHRWLGAVLLAAGAYFVIGRVSTLPAEHQPIWRVAAWVASGAIYIAHIGYEGASARSTRASNALRVALAVAIGAFLLAVAGMLHSLMLPSGMRLTWLIALIAWPAVTAIPAFVAAFVALAILDRVWHRRAG